MENFIGLVIFFGFCYGLYRYVEYRKTKLSGGGSGGGKSGDTKLK